jgi:formate hydrogenlyase subunit 3/multisubunit Na+/H+ antiporter MnhD subunit
MVTDMKLLPFPHSPRLSKQEFFFLEQWAALLIAIACLSVSAWAGFSGFRASASVLHSWLSASAVGTMKCWLTIGVALIGTILVRFAFYKPRRTTPAAPPYENRRLPQEDTHRESSAGPNLAKSMAIRKGNG